METSDLQKLLHILAHSNNLFSKSDNDFGDVISIKCIDVASKNTVDFNFDINNKLISIAIWTNK